MEEKKLKGRVINNIPWNTPPMKGRHSDLADLHKHLKVPLSSISGTCSWQSAGEAQSGISLVHYCILQPGPVTGPHRDAVNVCRINNTTD